MSIRRNTAINLAGTIVPMCVMLVTVPLYLKVLGDARYGVLALVWVVLGYFSFLDMGLGKATANQIAKAYDATSAERSEIFWTALLVNGVMGVIGAGILWLLGHYLLSSVLKMPDDFRQEAIVALPWMAATFPLALASSVLNGALEGRNQFFTVNFLQVITSTIFQLAPLSVAYWFSPSLTWVIPAAVVSRALMNLFFLVACHSHVPLVSFPRISGTKARSLFAYGGWVAITGAVGPMLDTIERLMIGAILSASAVTHYTVPMQLVGKLKVLPGGLSRALFPAFSSRPRSEAIIMAANSTMWLAGAMALAVIVGSLALRPFLELWVGSEISNMAAPIGEMLLVGVWINSVAHIPYFYLQASGRPDLVAKIHAAELIPYLCLAWVVINAFGLLGAAAIWVLRCTVEAVALFVMAGFAKKVALPLAVGGIAVFTVAMSLMHFEQMGLLWRAGAILACFSFGLAIAGRSNLRKHVPWLSA